MTNIIIFQNEILPTNFLSIYMHKFIECPSRIKMVHNVHVQFFLKKWRVILSVLYKKHNSLPKLFLTRILDVRAICGKSSSRKRSIETLISPDLDICLSLGCHYAFNLRKGNTSIFNPKVIFSSPRDYSRETRGLCYGV